MGKNQSTLENPEDESQYGIIPRSLQDIFQSIHIRKNQEEQMNTESGEMTEWKVYVSYLEVYNEQILDLLQPSAKSLALREDPGK